MKKKRNITCKNLDIIYLLLTATLGTISICQTKKIVHQCHTQGRGAHQYTQLAFALARAGQRGTSVHTQLAFARTEHINELTLIPFKAQPTILKSEFERVKS
jgi:hypothetical protein